MVSALSDDRIARRARDLGAFEYLTKPVDMDRYEASLIACAEGRKHVTRD
jgi:response regulator of citrate/malate metabolism